MNFTIDLNEEELSLLIKERVNKRNGQPFSDEEADYLGSYITDHQLNIGDLNELQEAINKKNLFIKSVNSLKRSDLILRAFLKHISDGGVRCFEIYGDLTADAYIIGMNIDGLLE